MKKSCFHIIHLVVSCFVVLFAHAEEGRPQLRILNGSDQSVEVFWIRSDRERKPHGIIVPDKDTIISTTLGHRFAIVGRRDKTEVIVTSRVQFQGFRRSGL